MHPESTFKPSPPRLINRPADAMESFRLSANTSLSSTDQKARAYRRFKRLIDVIISGAALIAALPIILLAIAAISLESSGTPIFKQRRVGTSGTFFDIYKIRTMHDGSHEQGFKTHHGDPRVTRVGKIL